LFYCYKIRDAAGGERVLYRQMYFLKCCEQIGSAGSNLERMLVSLKEEDCIDRFNYVSLSDMWTA